MAQTATKVELKPLEDQVVLEPSEAAAVSAGGVILPDTAKEKGQEGVVIAIGPGKTTDKGDVIKITQLKVGDRVIYSKYSGTEVKVDGKELLIISFKDIKSIIIR
jgi:chaperonin GroES